MDVDRELAKVRALADPTRVALYDVIGIAGDDGATDEQLRAAVPSARRTLAYDLEELKQAGWIERVDGDPVTWVRTDAPITWDSEMVADPRSGVLAQELERIILQRRADRIRDWLDERETAKWSKQWVAASISHDYTLHLQPADLVEFEERFVLLVDEYRRRGSQTKDAASTDDVETVLLTVTGIPFRV